MTVPEYVLEIRAAPAIGNESRIFCQDLFTAYMRHLDHLGCHARILAMESDEWGILSSITLIQGDCANLVHHSGQFHLRDYSIFPHPRYNRPISHRTADVRIYPTAQTPIAVTYTRIAPRAGGCGGQMWHPKLHSRSGDYSLYLDQEPGISWAELETLAARILAGRSDHPEVYTNPKLTLNARLAPPEHAYINWHGTTQINLSIPQYHEILDGVFPE